MVAAMRDLAATGGIKAAGICSDVRIRSEDGKTSDAIAVSLEHRAGDSVAVLMPYSKGRFTGLRFGGLTAGPASAGYSWSRNASPGLMYCRAVA